MNKRIYLLLLSIYMTSIAASAQCAGGRYMDEIFPDFTMDSVVYSAPYSLKMDIYQPAGDTLSARPLIIMAHEGTFITGDRESDVTVDSICWRYAKRGYVVASIDYRLASIFTMLSTDSTQPINEVIQAVSDGKAAIRYFVKDAATVNAYKIDTNNIFIGGNSAGAVLYMHVGYLDSFSACPSYIQAAMDSNGGFEGNSGNPGYTTKSKAIINLAGALNETSFVKPGAKPSVNCQGSDDMVVPYTCGYPNFGYPGLDVDVNLCGLGSLEPVYDSNSIYHASLVFPGAGHVPWDSDPAEFNSVDSIVKLFLYNMVCTNVLTVPTVAASAEVSLYPNPALDQLHIGASKNLSVITICDETGRLIFQATGIERTSYEINTAHFAKGVYFVKLSFSDADFVPVVKRLGVE